MRHYATVCKREQCDVLIASMDRHCAPYRLHMLAWDFDELPMQAKAGQVAVTERGVFLARHPDLEPSRLPGPPRLPINVTDTIRWPFFADVMEATGEPLTWQDGDQFYFSSPEPLYAELAAAGARFAVSPHRIPPRAAGLPGVCLETHRQYALYNSGFGWTADRAPLLEMAALTREWSYSEVVSRPGRRPLFGDQAHLEDVAERHNAHVIEHWGVNVAPWNVHGHRLVAGKPEFNVPHLVDGQPLITFHFSSLRLAPDGTVAQLASAPYEVEWAPGVVELLYRPYINAIKEHVT